MIQKIIKSILPASGVEKLKKIGELIANFTLRIAVSSKFLSSLYYILIAKDFRRENQAVIYGKLKYIEDLQSNLDSQYLLRRNIHRLEKGIIMQPRRDIFALDYIDETIKCYEKSVLDKGKDLPESTELQWAHDVLEQYFTIVGANPAIEPAKTRFLALDKPDRNGK